MYMYMYLGRCSSLSHAQHTVLFHTTDNHMQAGALPSLMHNILYCFTQQTIICKKDPPMLWAEIAVSVDGKAVALVDKAGYLWGGTPDFKVMHVHVLVHVHLEMLYKQVYSVWSWDSTCISENTVASTFYIGIAMVALPYIGTMGKLKFQFSLSDSSQFRTSWSCLM